MATYKAKVWDGSAWQTVGSNLLNSADYATKTYLSSSINALPGRNLLHNGAFQVHQRGTSTASITSIGYYTADRWGFDVVSMGTWTQSVENDAPTGSGFRKSWKALCSAAQADPTNPASTDYVYMEQKVEGQNLQAIKKGTSSAQQLTLSFWVKSNKTGTYICWLYDVDNARHVSASYTISSSATWEQKVITFPADLTGALDNDANASLIVRFWLAVGSSHTSGTLATTWAADVTANRAVGQTNLAAATNNYWQITGVQLEVGSAATGFEWKDYGQELRECQRYYRRYTSAIGLGTYPGWAAGYVPNATDLTGTFLWGTVFRSAPSVTFSSQTDFYLDRYSGPGQSTSMAVSAVSETSMRFAAARSAGGGSPGQGGQICSYDTATPYIAASADL